MPGKPSSREQAPALLNPGWAGTNYAALGQPHMCDALMLFLSVPSCQACTNAFPLECLKPLLHSSHLQFPTEAGRVTPISTREFREVLMGTLDEWADALLGVSDAF